jgi:class 3 adenylate cyclase
MLLASMQVIDLVHQHGGDVMRFAGDSIICSFSATKAEHALPDKGLAKATCRSVQCAADLSFQLGTSHYPICAKFTLRFRSKVGIK